MALKGVCTYLITRSIIYNSVLVEEIDEKSKSHLGVVLSER